MAIDKIGKRDVAKVLDPVTENSGPTTSLRVRSNLSSLFAWAIGEGICESNPVIGTNKADVPNDGKRDRVLSEDELAAIWRNLPAEGDFGRVIKLLILTGCREDEIGELAWSEIDGDRINLPAERCKNGHAHTVHLSSLALEQLPDRREGRPLVFGVGKGGFQGYAYCKNALDAKLNFDKPWRIHDIRRTVATGMAGIGILPHIVEATLNHLSGHKSGIAGVYNHCHL